ncbi:MAG: hypothetical protein J2P50_01385 [Hyphomicrobiaceae bacterium]|nr:hypothetical protein [Hyphomicrobiaceae bacterium]
MGHQSPIADGFFAELDQLGVVKVREQLAAGAWGKSGRRVKLAKLWLDDQRQTRLAQAGAAAGSQDAAKRSAAVADRSADTAEVAYAIARDANVRAALAIALAAASLIVQVALAFLRPS